MTKAIKILIAVLSIWVLSSVKLQALPTASITWERVEVMDDVWVIRSNLIPIDMSEHYNLVIYVPTNQEFGGDMFIADHEWLYGGAGYPDAPIDLGYGYMEIFSPDLDDWPSSFYYYRDFLYEHYTFFITPEYESPVLDLTGYAFFDVAWYEYSLRHRRDDDPVEITGIRITLPLIVLLDDDEEIAGHMQLLNELTWVEYNVTEVGSDIVKTVYYIIDGYVYESFTFLWQPPEIRDYVFDRILKSKRLKYWELEDGRRFLFDEPITEDMLVNNALYLYGVFEVDPYYVQPPLNDVPSGDFGDTPFDPLAVLTLLGLNDKWGHMLIYTIVCLLIIFALVALRASSTVISIVLITVTALFIFLGLLQWWVILLVLVSAGVIFLYNKRRSAEYE